MTSQLSISERDKDAEAKREKRSEAARIVIPDCVSPSRRERCLKDPELFLKTYFARRYRLPFGKHHYQMIDTICSRAKHGGRQSVAAPRGCGKSELAKGLLVFLVLAELVRFPLPVAATTDLAKRIYEDFRRKVARSELLYADFPEVCHPVRCLDGAPQRASKQHVNGTLTNIKWTSKELSLPHVEGSPYGGVKMVFFGLDAAFRGVNIDGDRPDFILIDDPETRESAKHLGQIEDREAIVDRDISGLASQEENLSIALLSTIQNRFCYSFRVTDRKIKPAFNGMRFGLIETWPTNMAMWDDYVSLRQKAQSEGDEHGLPAVAFYLENREAMDAGVEMLSESFVPIRPDGGQDVVHSAIQQAFNKIADISMGAFLAEFQNDPQPEDEAETLGLTAGLVANRVNGLMQGQAHEECEWFTVGLDIGKHASHWVKIGWWGNAIGTIVDYGVMETWGLGDTSDIKVIQLALLNSMQDWKDGIMESNIPILTLIDSGSYSDAVYEFCRRAGTPFFPSKGWAAKRFNLGTQSETRYPFIEAYAQHQKQENVWLYNVNTEHWKLWLQHRFKTHTFDENGHYNDGSLSLFSSPDRKKHLSFAHHIVAEEEREFFEVGKGRYMRWCVLSRNNHYLDATALACAASGCIGVRLVPRADIPSKRVATLVAPQKHFTNQFGQPYLATQR